MYMVQYKCGNCLKLFKLKGDYTRHLKRKIPCKKSDENQNNHNKNKRQNNHIIVNNHQLAPKTQKITKNNDMDVLNDDLDDKEPKSERQCQYCKKIFSRVSSLDRHLKGRCKVKKQQDNQKEDLLQKLINEMKEMKEKMETLENENKEYREYKQSISKQQNINQTNIGQQNITQANIGNQFNQFNHLNQLNQQNNINIKLLAFGKEDISHITDEVYKRVLNKGFKSVPNFVEHVHFNRNKPENHNIYISNIRTNYVLVYDGEDWKLKEKDDALQQLIDEKTETLSNKFDVLIDKLDEHTIRKFRRFLDQRDENEVISNIKNDLKLLLYNNRRIPERTKELISASNISIGNTNKELVPVLK
jgi:hypothetical protein